MKDPLYGMVNWNGRINVAAGLMLTTEAMIADVQDDKGGMGMGM